MRNALGHIGMGALLMAPFVAFGYPWLGWGLQSAYWLGREVAHHEGREKEAGRDATHGLNALRGFYFWQWSRDGLRDLFAPVAFLAFVAWVISRV